MNIDNRAGSLFGLYNSANSASDSSLNVPVHSSSGISQLSPYLNVDPTYLHSQPEFLTLEGASQKRGRFELAFSQIGGLCISGAGLGGAQGFYRGYLETNAAGHIGKIRRTQMLNYVMKRGTNMSNTLGAIAVMYSGLGFGLQHARGGTEDGYNTMGAATLTGLLYKSTSGLKKCAIGGAVGLVLASMYVAFSTKDKMKDDYTLSGY